MYDLIIIGGGPAAISAGIYAARKKLKTLLICAGWGGQMTSAWQVENYPGFESILGAELVQKFVQHLRKFEIEIREGEKVKAVKLVKKTKKLPEFSLLTNKDKYLTQAIIIATGKSPGHLNVPGEKEFLAKGVSYCSTCDAPLFKNKEVAVIGGGNSGVGASLELAKYAKKIYLCQFEEELTADELLQEKVKKISKIIVLTKVAVKEIYGDKFVKGLSYQDRFSKEVKNLSVQGVFIAIGFIPNSQIVKNIVKLNKQGEIKINAKNMTSQKGIFAAGDVTDVPHKQIVVATGEGAKAALSAYQYLWPK